MAFEFKTCATSEGIIIEGLYEIQPKLFGDMKCTPIIGHFNKLILRTDS